ncbi:MAG TPA: SRPBCC domain-containing protein [Candidatus Eremiobacteraceae bacterium]
MAAEADACSSKFPDLTITRVFDAPRDLVFQAWTDPNQLAKWWGPHHFTNPVCEVDVREGGAIRIHMRGPEGTVYPMTGVFNEVVAPERLVFTSTPLDENGDPLFEILNTVVFEEQGEKTRLTLHARVLSATDQAAQYLDGMEEGWTQSLERLAEVLPT